MCGIIGVIGKLPEEKIFLEARDKLAHRGPDDAGVYFSKKDRVSLGHRRLSIIDLTEAGHQPFYSDDGRYFLIFNGEIYNYLEIKDELKVFYNFKTKTDTEVLLAAYIKWGEKCLDKFNGMFAFAIWDNKEQELFCARDRLGIKPFFYYIENGNFSFASEIKALLALGAKNKENDKMIFDYLYHGLYDHTRETFFKDIFKLPAGNYAFWKNGKLKICEYWNLTNKRHTFKNAATRDVIEEFKRILSDSIKLRFRSDVPIGIYLSSGLDSNTLLYYSKEITGIDVETFSMCFDSNEYNECKNISSLLTDEQRKHWNMTTIDNDKIFELSHKMNIIQDQPFGGIPTLGFGKLNQEAQEKNVTVLLHGQGVDEILAGYKYYNVSAESGANTENKVLSQDLTVEVNKSIISNSFLKKFSQKTTNFKYFDNNLLNLQYRDITYAKIPRALRFTDHASMAYGRELRVPYLDHRLVEFCFMLDDKHKINKNSQKVLIREAMKDVLPEIIKNKEKKAYGAIQVEILKNKYKTEIHSIINSNSFKNREYWNHKELNNAVNLFFSRKLKNSFFIWQCINLDMWFKQYIEI